MIPQLGEPLEVLMAEPVTNPMPVTILMPHLNQTQEEVIPIAQMDLHLLQSLLNQDP